MDIPEYNARSNTLLNAYNNNSCANIAPNARVINILLTQQTKPWPLTEL